jgi:hypothetical protein
MTLYRSNVLLALLAAFTFFSGISSAEEPSKRGGVSFTVLPLSSLPYENLYYRNGKTITPIEIRKGKRSMSYPLSSAEFIELFTDHEDPELRYRLIGKAPLLTGTSRILYFLRETGSNKEGARPLGLFGIDDSKATFPDSSFRFINFINAPLSIEFNKKQFDMKPGQSKVHKLNLTEAGSFTPFIVKDMEERTLGGTRLFSHAASREMVLIFPAKKGKKRLDIRYFSD